MTKLYSRPVASMAALLLTAGLVGCGSYVKKDQFNDEVSDMRSQMQQQGQRIDQNASDIKDLQGKVNGLQSDLQQLRQDFQAKVTELENGVKFAMPIHFDFDKSDVRSVDRPLLDRFASIAKKYYGGATITVEGFADPAGSQSYNRRLSQARAKAVADYLSGQAGLSADKIKTVGYGESRLVSKERGPGAKGIENRRVTFVIEYAGQTMGG
jgi:peptidoglycan-associated lipoprotein